MDHTPITSALALNAMAVAFDAQRGKLPKADELQCTHGLVTVARQITELARSTDELADEVIFRSVEPNQTPDLGRANGGLAEAITPASAATTAVGSVARQLAFLNRTEHLPDQPDAADARAAAHRVIEDALKGADAAPRKTTRVLTTASETTSPPPNLLQAAAQSRSASRPTAPEASAPTTTPKPQTPPGRPARGR